MTGNMTDSSQDNFNIPPGFAVEEIKGQLYLEDLEEDDELWLIRMPCDIELSSLDKRKIFLSSETEGLSIKNFKTESGKLLECCAETCEISNTCVVLPKRQDGHLCTVKKAFKGSVLVSEGLSLNNEVEIKSEKEDSSYLNDSYSVIESHEENVVKKRKKSRSDLDTSEINIKYEDIHEQCEDANTSSSKKKKSAKKKRHSQTDFDPSELNYETEAAENVDSPISQKKKKHSKSRKSSEKIKIKGEPISMDLDDEFPTCSSQK